MYNYTHLKHFCKSHTETLCHLFLECMYCREILACVKSCMHNYNQFKFALVIEKKKDIIPTSIINEC